MSFKIQIFTVEFCAIVARFPFTPFGKIRLSPSWMLQNSPAPQTFYVDGRTRSCLLHENASKYKTGCKVQQTQPFTEHAVAVWQTWPLHVSAWLSFTFFRLSATNHTKIKTCNIIKNTRDHNFTFRQVFLFLICQKFKPKFITLIIFIEMKITHL